MTTNAMVFVVADFRRLLAVSLLLALLCSVLRCSVRRGSKREEESTGGFPAANPRTNKVVVEGKHARHSPPSLHARPFLIQLKKRTFINNGNKKPILMAIRLCNHGNV